MAVDTQVHFELLEHPDRVEVISRLVLRRGRLTPDDVSYPHSTLPTKSKVCLSVVAV